MNSMEPFLIDLWIFFFSCLIFLFYFLFFLSSFIHILYSILYHSSILLLVYVHCHFFFCAFAFGFESSKVMLRLFISLNGLTIVIKRITCYTFWFGLIKCIKTFLMIFWIYCEFFFLFLSFNDIFYWKKKKMK